MATSRNPEPNGLNLLTATIGDLEKALTDGTTTSEQIVSQYLDQIAAYNGYLHGVISTAPRGNVLHIARSLDEERVGGNIRGPLHGVPVILKDNIATGPELGMETTAGTYALVRSKVKRSAPLAKQLQDAGAIILAKANLSELSNFRGFRMPTGWSAVGGLTQSPYVVGGKKWDDGFGGHSAPGGWSSGSCSAVAAGFAPASVGTDTNGSILCPATRHDVYAMKPTLGLISQEGIVPICLEFDSAGPIARSARDIALLMDAMVDPDNGYGKPVNGGSYTTRLTKSFEGLRIGVLDPKEWHLPDYMAVPNHLVDTEIDQQVSAAYEKLRSLGVTVKDVTLVSLDEIEVDGVTQITRLMNSGFKKDFEAYLQDLEASKVRSLKEVMEFIKDHAELEFPPESPNMNRLEEAASFELSEDDRNTAIRDMRDWGRKCGIDKCLEGNDINIILCRADSEISHWYAAAGYPMASLPLSYSSFNRRPFDICALASQYQEGILMQLMSAWEEVFNKERVLPTWLGGDPDLGALGRTSRWV